MSIKACAIITLVRTDDGISITSVDVQYYLSTSSTTLSGGSWTTTAPAWENGKYMWSKTITILSNGTKTESTPVCITGAKGSNGSTGAAGTGIASITEEYYLSTSKTAQTGGTWVETPPVWVNGKYMWTRSKIVYKNPSSTAYTKPVCDSSWEAANDAAKTATNFIRKDNNSGLVISEFTGEDTSGNFDPAKLGNNVLIDQDSVDIRNGTNVLATYTANQIQLGTTNNLLIGTNSIDFRQNGNVLASFTPNTIYLGKNNPNSVIDLCGHTVTMYANMTDEIFNIMAEQTSLELNALNKTNLSYGKLELHGGYSSLYPQARPIAQIRAYDINDKMESFIQANSSVAIIGVRNFTTNYETTMQLGDRFVIFSNVEDFSVGNYALSKGNQTSQSSVIPVIKSDSVMEIGKYLDFHDIGHSGDYSHRLYVSGTTLYSTGGPFSAEGDFHAKKMVYLQPTSSIDKAGYSTSWQLGHKGTGSIIRQTSCNGWNPWLYVRGVAGSWTQGVYSNDGKYYITYASDTTINSKNGTDWIWRFEPSGLFYAQGDVTIGRSLTVTNQINANLGITVQNAGVELYGNTPFIDFHYNKSSSDYTSRLIADASNTLTVAVDGVYKYTFAPLSFRPYKDGGAHCGYPSYRWNRVYATNSAIGTSDENEKNILGGFDERYECFFMKLKPILYMWKNFGNEEKPHDRIHFGLGAQTTLKMAKECGLDEMSVAAICRDDLDSPTVDGRWERYGLAYEELIPLTIHETQKALREIDSLKSQNDLLKAQVNALNQGLLKALAEIERLKRNVA